MTNVYVAHDKAKDFHRALLTHNVVLFSGGRGSGKTAAGTIEALLHANRFPHGAGMIVEPTAQLVNDVAIPEFLKWTPPHWITRIVRSPYTTVQLRNGAEIRFRSADNPDSLRGSTLSWVWFDEPRNLQTREAFDVAVATMRMGVRAWLTSTPAGIFHWLYKMFVENPAPNSAVIYATTADNPHTSPDFKSYLQSLYTGAFAAQELEAKWVSFEGLIYDTFSVSENVQTSAEYNPDLPVYWFVDDGYVHGGGVGHANYHPRVILCAQVTAQGGINIFDELYHTTTLAEVSIKTALELPYKQPDVVFVDSSASDLIGRMRMAGLMAGGATHRVTDGIKKVRRLVQDGNGVRLLKIHPRCSQLIREMQSYRWSQKMTTADGDPPPLKVDDHGCDALRYGVYHLT